MERRVVRNQVSFVNADSQVTLDYRDEAMTEPVNAVTVLRARFDPWLAERAEEAGAFLMPGLRVEGLLTEPGAEPVDGGAPRNRVVGVRAGEDELRAHVVVAADGSTRSWPAAPACGPTRRATNWRSGSRGVFALPREVIEERFALTGDEGAAWALAGDCTRGVAGGAFCYTNAASLSVGLVVRLDDLMRRGEPAADLFDHLVHHRVLAPYLAGAELIDYGSHLVAEGGAYTIGDIATDGLVVVGEAAGLALNTGLTVRGMDLAVGSGVCAAQAISAALEAGDVSGTGLATYRALLFHNVVGRDMTTYAKAPAFLLRERLYRQYGELAAGMLAGVVPAGWHTETAARGDRAASLEGVAAAGARCGVRRDGGGAGAVTGEHKRELPR